MGLKAKKVALTGFADQLVAEGLLSEKNAKASLKQALSDKTTYVHHLIEKKLVRPDLIAKSASAYFGVPLFDLDSLTKDLVPVDLVREELIEKHQALPLFRRDEILYIGISDPTNIQAVYDIKFQTGLNIVPILVEQNKLKLKIEASETGQARSLFAESNDFDLAFDDAIIDDNVEEHEAEVNLADDAPVVRFVNNVLLDAIRQQASDIHFEPYEKSCRVRFRIDGILYEVATPPINLAPRIAARLKVMSKLDISEKRLPQDGHFKLKLSKKTAIDFRVSSCPIIGGEKLVLRVLDPAGAKMGIDQLGYEDEQKQHFMKAINEPQGMVLVTGPTGSGKTVSLYTALNILNTPERNISTVEDPVEINLDGINQVNINSKAGLDFATALRSFLRQDPDVIMVGEIRDLPTAEIAIKAAQTGHMVLSTLHTNSTPETLGRLINMGVPPFNLATSVSLIIAQRLARRLCEHCKMPAKITDNALREQGLKAGQSVLPDIYQAVGCEQCTKGYQGRVGIYEVLPVSTAIGQIIMDGGNAIEIAAQADKEGLQTLRMSGLKKVLEGVTSLEEINRVTKD